MSELEYEVVDVFTDRPFTGNPLAVVFGADGLSGEQLQAIASEFNLSETVFVLPPTAADATYRVRIFTPVAELPFAGHPSVGAAVTQLRRGAVAAGTVVQECGAGLLRIAVSEAGTATLTGGEPTVGPELDPAPLLAAVGLGEKDFAGPPPRSAGCGLEFPFLSVVPDAVARAASDAAASRLARVSQVCVFAWSAADRTAHTRVFVPALGVPEDPATGSAALGFGVWLVASGLLPGEDVSAYSIRQGVEMHRPSTLDCTVTAEGGRAIAATVTGRVVPAPPAARAPVHTRHRPAWASTGRVRRRLLVALLPGTRAEDAVHRSQRRAVGSQDGSGQAARRRGDRDSSASRLDGPAVMGVRDHERSAGGGAARAEVLARADVLARSWRRPSARSVVRILRPDHVTEAVRDRHRGTRPWRPSRSGP